MNLLDLFVRGGPFMYPILLCSVLAVVVVIERFIVLHRANMDTGQFMLKLRSVLQRNDILAGVTFCSKTEAPIASIMRKGLTVYPEGHERVREAIENAGKEEAFRLEHRLGILANLAGIAPLLGFLGTVTGMIGAFRAIEQLGGAVNPSDLAGGIWEALLTTAFGLMVGIVAYGFYNYFVSSVGRLVFELERASEEFIELVRTGKLETAPETSGGGGRKSSRDDEYFRAKRS